MAVFICKYSNLVAEQSGDGSWNMELRLEQEPPRIAVFLIVVIVASPKWCDISIFYNFTKWSNLKSVVGQSGNGSWNRELRSEEWPPLHKSHCQKARGEERDFSKSLDFNVLSTAQGHTRTMKQENNKHSQKKCEQVLFVYVFTIIPPRLTDPCNFITVLLVTRELEQTMLLLLFWSAACCVTPHGLHTADRR